MFKAFICSYPFLGLKGLKRIGKRQLKMSIMKLRLKCMLAEYFEFRKCFKLRVSDSVMILRGFQAEL